MEKIPRKIEEFKPHDLASNGKLEQRNDNHSDKFTKTNPAEGYRLKITLC